jgi:glycosyltransferase involved in cell wall biosynthesis
MPFFTPLWSDISVRMIIFQLAREVWWHESPFPLSAVGYLLEPAYLQFYRHTPVITISRSTATDLRRLGFQGHIAIVPVGISAPPAVPAVKEKEPTFLYVGRLAPSKRIRHLIQALALFRESNGRGTLWVAGSGSARYINSLRELSIRLNVADHVIFRGRVTDAERSHLMTAAHALLMASVREGWGMVITEANSCGTPAIGYDVPGLRDAIVNNVTGLLVAPEPAALSRAMTRLMCDDHMRLRLSHECRRRSSAFTFDSMADAVHHELLKAYNVSQSAKAV